MVFYVVGFLAYAFVGVIVCEMSGASEDNPHSGRGLCVEEALFVVAWPVALASFFIYCLYICVEAFCLWVKLYRHG